VWISLADLDEAIFGIDRVIDFEARLIRQENKDCLAIEAIVTEEHGPRPLWKCAGLCSATRTSAKQLSRSY